jgi:short-subunit dehydrogenase
VKGRSKGIALVTGASRGIGKAICEALVRKGYTVIGTCRDPRKVKKDETVDGVQYLPLDLTSTKSINALAVRVKQVDVLVNNAGTSMIGPIEETDMDAVRELFELNFFGQLALTQRFLRPMREKRQGKIIFVGSMSGETGLMYHSMYAASKAAIRAAARTLRQEVKEFGVSVSVLAPFHIKTTIPQEKQYKEKSPYSEKVKKVKESRDTQMATAPSPRVVSGKVLQILEDPRPRFFYPVGKGGEMQAFLIRHLPRGLVDSIANKIFDSAK